jgi:GST-like protein
MSEQPIALYYWPTPNGWKISILLEELGLPYDVNPINITHGEQFSDDFLRISPNNKIPAIVDPQGPGGKPFTLAESGAILLYLGEKMGGFLPQDPADYYRALQWLMFQMGHLGPMAGQAHHFRNYAPEQLDYAVERYTNEVRRIYNVMDRHLAESTYMAGGEYSIVDMACWPWVKPHAKQGQDITEFPHLQRWFEAVGERPAVQRGIEVLADQHATGKSGQGFDEKAREVLFGNTQFQKR